MTDVLVVEDVDTMRSLLEQVVASIPGFRVSGSARNLWEARLELSRRRPALLLLDEILPGESSLDLVADAQALGVGVLLITGLEDPVHALPPGVLGRLVKPAWDTLDDDRRRFAQALVAALNP